MNKIQDFQVTRWPFRVQNFYRRVSPLNRKWGGQAKGSSLGGMRDYFRKVNVPSAHCILVGSGAFDSGNRRLLVDRKISKNDQNFQYAKIYTILFRKIHKKISSYIKLNFKGSFKMRYRRPKKGYRRLKLGFEG